MIYLASRSPRRRELLEQIGVSYALLDVEVDEARHAGETPRDYVVRLALEKARAGHALVADGTKLPVLGADTVVVVEGEVLCKPVGQADALNMLARLSGRTHQVYTGVALVSEVINSRLSVSEVTFRQVSLEEARAYWASGEPVDKAGGYAIQGLGAVFIREIHGSYSGVMGLPLYETAEMLREIGIIFRGY